MEKIPEKYLPIGTVVMLKGGTKRVMINGFCAVEEKNKQTYWDYTGCMYPEGFLAPDKTFFFNHSHIERIFHLGLTDKEEVEFKKSLKDITALYVDKNET